MRLDAIADKLIREVKSMTFASPVAYVYNPLEYARRPHRRYLQRYGRGPKEVLLIGMNPGPWGMAQTGIPFGEVSMVRDWLGIRASVGKPKYEHPKRPVQGFQCRRSEVSGARLWGWVRDTFHSPERFFDRFFITNYCPLCFLEDSGRNRTPDKLPVGERAVLLGACDRALRATVDHLQPQIVIGIGKFAESRAHAALDGVQVRIGRILHPSPANPLANRDWAGQITRQLAILGVTIPSHSHVSRSGA